MKAGVAGIFLRGNRTIDIYKMFTFRLQSLPKVHG